MPLVERKITLDECQLEGFQPYQQAFFSDTFDYEGLRAKGIDHVVVIDPDALTASDMNEFELSDRIQQLLELHERIIVVNLCAVTRVDSMGLGELVRSFTRVKRGGGMMPIVNAPEQLRWFVESCKFL